MAFSDFAVFLREYRKYSVKTHFGSNSEYERAEFKYETKQLRHQRDVCI